MTTRFNYFGAVYTDIVSMYPGTILADYDGGGASGQTRIETALGRISREVASAMTPEIYAQITQTTANLGLTPTVAGTVHLWVYPPLAAMEIRNYGLSGNLTGNFAAIDDWYRKPTVGFNEATSYSITAATGAITGIPALNVGERVYATYDIDVSSASYSLPSVADLVRLGTAAELGARLYSDAQQEWKLVDDYRTRYRGAFESSEGGQLGRALKGTWLPDELRALNYWKEIDRKSEAGVSTVRFYRT